MLPPRCHHLNRSALEATQAPRTHTNLGKFHGRPVSICQGVNVQLCYPVAGPTKDAETEAVLREIGEGGGLHNADLSMSAMVLVPDNSLSQHRRRQLAEAVEKLGSGTDSDVRYW
jgi:hypothetical protein